MTAAKRRAWLSPVQMDVYGALLAIGGEGVIGEIRAVLKDRESFQGQDYRALEAALSGCVRKGWVTKRKRGRKVLWRSTLPETEAVVELFEELVARFLEGRPREVSEAVARRLAAVQLAGSPAGSKRSTPATGRETRALVAEHEAEIGELRRVTTKLRVEVQGLRALVEGATPATARRRAKGAG